MPIPYYPSERYITKNLAPESFNYEPLASLAEAQTKAVKSGLLSENLAGKLLPNALVEGWDNYGVIDGSLGYPANKRRDAMFAKMGMHMANSDSPDLLKKWANVQRDTVGGYRLLHPSQDMSARMAAIVLAEKAHLYGEDNAIERWNGKGKAVEDYYGESVKADSKNHVRKVDEMIRMLNHPKNASMRNVYRGLLGE